MAEHGDGLSHAGLVVARDEHAAEEGRDAQHLEVVVGHLLAEDALGRSVFGETQGTRLERVTRDARKAGPEMGRLWRFSKTKGEHRAEVPSPTINFQIVTVVLVVPFARAQKRQALSMEQVH